jgi:hypothetical protein
MAPHHRLYILLGRILVILRYFKNRQAPKAPKDLKISLDTSWHGTQGRLEPSLLSTEYFLFLISGSLNLLKAKTPCIIL